MKETCYFPSGTNKGYTEDEIIYACYTENETRTCSLMGREIEPICNDIKTAYANLGKAAPASGNYTVYWNEAQTSHCDMSKSPAWTSIRDFTHGTTYTYNLPRPGTYRFEAYGAGGYLHKNGGYTWGIFRTESTPQFFIIVGSSGGSEGGGGGGTEIRYGLDWRSITPMASGTHANNYLRDKYRIMVAGGGAASNGGGGNNCGGGGTAAGCKGVGGTGRNGSPGGLGRTYMYGIGYSSTYNGSLDTGGYSVSGGVNNAPVCSQGVGYSGGNFGGGAKNSCTGGGGEGFGSGAGWLGGKDGGGGGYGAAAWGAGGGYGGGAHNASYGSGGGGRVCLETMPSGWPACSKDIFVFDEGGGITGGNTTANGGTGWQGFFRIWLLEK